MALNITEAAKLSTDTLAKGVLETFVQVSPILDRIPLMNIDGNAYAYNEEATLPGGIIPAYAGNTHCSPRQNTSGRDHPRVCGEHLSADGGDPAAVGSSPRMRGTRLRRRYRHRAQGIIPAYAGNT